jgi:exosortase J
MQMARYGPALRCVLAIVAVSAVGLFALSRPIFNLLVIWITDPLRSIGMLFPIVSVALIVWEVKRMEWKVNGTWWGLAPLALAILAGHLRETMVLMFEIGPHMVIYFPPDALVLFGYASGLVLLFGGTRLYRRSLFPLGLLLFVNPVPHDFNLLVDLPLQAISAHVARGFAMALGQKLTSDQLRLMFTPGFGFYVAPGCNGIRGSITMGYIALIVGYVFRFRWKMLALTVACAVLLGYVFNLMRLCLLVVYYLIALHLTWLQNLGRNADYLIGSCLFLTAAGLLAMVVLSAEKTERPAATAEEKAGRVLTLGDNSPRLIVLAMMVALGTISYAHPLISSVQQKRQSAPINLDALYPAHLGGFDRTRAWKEDIDISSTEVYDWAEYRSQATGELVTVGISPILGAHDAIKCHLGRGEDPGWTGAERMRTSDGQSVNFSAFFEDDGISQFVVASTVCGPGYCGETAAKSSHFKIMYSRPLAQSLLDESLGRPVPLLIKAETNDMNVPQDVAREHLLTLVRSFVSSANLSAFAGNYFTH